MSAIGDYVHYYKRNYRYWGTNQIKTTYSEKWDKVYERIKNELAELTVAQFHIANAKKMETVYNNLFYSKTSVAQKSADFRRKLEISIQESLNEQYGLAAGKFNIDTLTIDETELQKRLSNAIERTRASLYEIELQKESMVRELLTKVDRLIVLLNQNEFDNIIEIRERLKKAQIELIQIKNRLQTKISRNLSLATYSDIESVNAIILEFNRVPSLYNQNQYLFQWILPFVGLKINEVAKEGLADEMENIASDFNRDSNSNIKMELDMPDLKKKVKVVDIDITINNVNISTNSTLEESEISISYTDKPNLIKNPIRQQMPLNMKDIELLKQQSLYNILSLNNHYNFSNHYLNIVTKARKDGKVEESDNAKILQANRMLKGLIISKSNNKMLSNYLVVNDSKNRKINIYSLKALQYLLQNKILDGKGKYSNIVDIAGDMQINQKWSKINKEDRIDSLISTIRRYRVSARINGSDLKYYLNMLKGFQI